MFAQVLCKHVHCRLQQSRALLTNLLRYSLSAQAGFCERTPSPFEGASAISSPSFCRGSRPRDLRLSRRCCKIVDQTGSSALCVLRLSSIYFHAFAAAVSQASLVIKSPSSLLAPHSWTQLKEAVSIFEIAGASGAPCSMYTPRLKVLQEKAYTSLQNLLSVPFGLGDGGLSDALLEGEIARSILYVIYYSSLRQGLSR